MDRYLKKTQRRFDRDPHQSAFAYFKLLPPKKGGSTNKKTAAEFADIEKALYLLW